MSGNTDAAACEYTHDISGPRFENIDGDVWSCPHAAGSESARCALHRPSSQSEQVRSLLRDACARASDDARELQCFGARCDHLDLGFLSIGGEGMFPIDLREADISGDLRFAGSELRQPVRLDGATIGGALDCEQAVFERTLSLRDATICGAATFEFARFEDWVETTGLTFEDKVCFNGAVLARGLSGAETTFEGRAEFVNTNFEELANLRDSTFRGFAKFDGPEFLLDARFDGSTFEGPAFFETAKFHQVAVFRDIDFEGPVSFRNCMVHSRASFQGTVFGDAALFPGAEFEGRTTFERTAFGHGVDFRAVTVDELRFEPTVVSSAGEAIDLTRTVIESGTVRPPSEGVSVIDLSGAVLGDVELRSDRADMVLDSFRLVDVEYDGFQFDGLEDEFRERNGRLESTGSDRSDGWVQHGPGLLSSLAETVHAIARGSATDQHSNEVSERTYRKAKNGANAVGQPKMASHFFIREMLYRRKRHAARLYDSERSRIDRLTSGFQWAANVGMYVTACYGERPSWTIATSVVSVLAFTVLYAVSGVYAGTNRLLQSLLLSSQSFVTFILGRQPDSTSLTIEFLSVLQGFMGAFLVAVFVFTLTRTVHR